MMRKILLFTFISTVLNQEVFKFEKSDFKEIDVLKFCDKIGKYRCSSKETCCLTGLPDPNKYQCCGLEKANCCNNGKFCCPESYICSSNNDNCYPSLKTIFLNLPVNMIDTKVVKNYQDMEPQSLDVVCPDGQTQCDPGTTCCQLKDKSYQCCPLVNAVCCSDNLHCCPQNTSCNVAKGTCDKVSIPFPYINSVQKRFYDIFCNDSRSQCSNGQTCCISTDGSYGCCPYTDAVCCSDKIHCCPHGTVCDIQNEECNAGPGPVIKKQIPSEIIHRRTYPDGFTPCKEHETCCSKEDGSYGCCEFRDAVCCSDHIHCCRHGYTCNLEYQMCTKGNEKIRMLSKIVSTETKAAIEYKGADKCKNENGDVLFLRKPTMIVCPDGSQCGEDQTCCKIGDGSYACCNGTDMVCCSDHKHCCRKGYTCNVIDETCTKESNIHTMWKRT